MDIPRLMDFMDGEIPSERVSFVFTAHDLVVRYEHSDGTPRDMPVQKAINIANQRKIRISDFAK